jgi:hypothetical protein
MRSRIFAVLLTLPLLGATCARPIATGVSPPLEPSADCFARVAGFLASDEMGGRGVGTQGLEEAAAFLEDQLAILGLAPPGGSYRQRFQMITGVASGSGNALSFNGERLEAGKDFAPLGFSSSGSFEGRLVFAGYGLRAEPLGYDDYAGLDVRGRVVLAMRYEPGESDPESPFDGRRPTRFSDLRYKAHVAREAGAAALLFVDPPAGAHDERLPVLKQEGPISRAGLPVLQVTRAVAEQWLASAGHGLAELQAAIDASNRPRSLDLPSIGVRGAVDLAITEATVSNIVGILPGRGDAAREVVVAGAHYDHLGVREHGSLAPGEQAIHNGADDNASGVAAMLCGVGGLARDLGGRSEPRRTLVVAAFAAEETGLGGSGWYVSHPPLPLESTVAMVNLDMVGRLRDSRLSVLGTDSAPEWEGLLAPVAADHGLHLVTGGDGYGPSDQTSFYEKGIPVAHLFTGAHTEYHTPADDIETLSVEGGRRVAAFLHGALERLLRGERLTYRASTGPPLLTGDTRGFGSYLGTIPDYTRIGMEEDGVLLLDVRKGGPADAAGLRGGDRIVGMAGIGVRNLYDMTFVLRDHRPGETIEIEFIRDGERSKVEAKLGQRGEMP